MATYRVTYIDSDGKNGSRLVNVDNESQLQPYLKSMELNVISIKQVPDFYSSLNFLEKLQKPNNRQVIEILENLQVVVQSGLPMTTALNDMADGADTKYISDMLMDISHRIQTSMSLSEAMSKYSDIFGETTIGLVRIGEETGELDQTLRNAAQYLTRMENLKSKVKSAMILPSITLLALFGAMIFWMIRVMPELIDAFDSFDIDLPAFTKMFMAASYFIQENFVKFLVSIVTFIVLFIYARKKSRIFKFRTDQLILKMPVFGNIVTLYNYAFVAEYTRLMIAAGLPLFQALGILKDSLSNSVFRLGIQNARELISSGSALSQALKSQKLFSPLIIRMIYMGEETGQLEGQLGFVANHYFDKVDYISENIAKIIQPVITVILGGFMVMMIVAFIFPITDMIGNLMNTK